jgi:hypothetical protein
VIAREVGMVAPRQPTARRADRFIVSAASDAEDEVWVLVRSFSHPAAKPPSLPGGAARTTPDRTGPHCTNMARPCQDRGPWPQGAVTVDFVEP